MHYKPKVWTNLMNVMSFLSFSFYKKKQHFFFAFFAHNQTCVAQIFDVFGV